MVVVVVAAAAAVVVVLGWLMRLHQDDGLPSSFPWQTCPAEGMHSQSKKNIWTAPPLPRTMWVSNMHFLSSRYFRQKSWTQGMSFCMATDGYSDGCAIDLTRLRLLACWTAPWHQPHASNTTRVPPVETPLWLHKIKDFTHLLRHWEKISSTFKGQYMVKQIPKKRS